MLFYRYVRGSETHLKVFSSDDDIAAWEATHGFAQWERSTL